ncbi:SRPBCC family protein [Halobacillus sp. ACCC02827]|uniref:hypothetical protein n=1 Tax=unclassified Halobacillus TaxID=2636472 RepID=UPI000780C851|nr:MULTISPECIES: hypothetical protein [unclassified Halobacillus]WJE14236.1 SRPBCC family protein [Halobacillus sp. ACCC02827]
MIKWKEERKLQENIEDVWVLFSDENIKRIMPKVVEHQLIKGTETEAGAVHQQTYKEGDRLESYEVRTLAYEDIPQKKHKKIQFVISGMFEVTADFQLRESEDGLTMFQYSGRNKGITVLSKLMLLFANRKGNARVVREFMDRVEREAEMKH